MLASRVGLLAGLIMGGLGAFPSHHTHQVERPHRALSVALRRALPPAPRRHSTRPSRATRTTAAGPSVAITHAALVRWMKVHVCEERGHGWHVHGPTYWGGLGWMQATWDQFKRADFPARADLATVAEQVWAAQRFAGYYHLVPDQHGCTGSY